MMKSLNYHFQFIKLSLFWLLVFNVLRVFFLVYYFPLLRLEGVGLWSVFKVFSAAFWLDVSTIGYLLLFPLLVSAMALIKPSKVWRRVVNAYVFFILLAYCLIVLGETGLYGEWKTKLSYKAISYLRNPDEVINSVSNSVLILLVTTWFAISIILFRVYKRWFSFSFSASKGRSFTLLLQIPIWVGLLFLAIRGGLREIPITTSAAYFSSHNILNVVAVNPAYNLMVNTIDARVISRENIFNSMPTELARQIVVDLHQTECDSTVSILKTDKPNIVVLLLESWSADLIESLGGESGITPNFRSLEKEGLLFTNFYASANRSQQAIGSLFAGIPGLPLTTITNHPEKYAALPSMIRQMNKNAYHTSFYFGGQLIYGNILSYLIYNEFDLIVEGKDIDEDFPRGKLGVHDSYMLPWYAHQLNMLPEPFFSTVFTLSSHSPYDFPMEHHIQWPQVEKDFINSAYYTDQALGKFFAVAKQQGWYDNTLFLILADHSHNTYRNHPLESFEYRKIPMLIMGPALIDAFRGATCELISGNTDVPATLMAQLGMDHSEFFWSKNLMNNCYEPFAYFETNEGLGFKTPDGHFVWNKKVDVYYQKNLPPDKEEKIIGQGKAYLQVWFDEFLSY